jgi:hypothetical protein
VIEVTLPSPLRVVSGTLALIVGLVAGALGGVVVTLFLALLAGLGMLALIVALYLHLRELGT